MTSYNHLHLVKHGLVPINQRISEYKFQEGSEMSLDKGGSGTLTSQIRKLKPKLSSELATLTLRIKVRVSVLTSTQSTEKRSLWKNRDKLSSVGRWAPVTVRAKPKARWECPWLEDKPRWWGRGPTPVGSPVVWGDFLKVAVNNFKQVIKIQLRTSRCTRTFWNSHVQLLFSSESSLVFLYWEKQLDRSFQFTKANLFLNTDCCHMLIWSLNSLPW